MHPDDDFSGFDSMYPEEHYNGTSLQLSDPPTQPVSQQPTTPPQPPLERKQVGKTGDPTPWSKGDLERAKERHKRCAKCSQLKAISEFPTHDTSGDGYASYCKQCRNALNRRRRENNPAARLKHHISTRVVKQLKDCSVQEPEGLTTNLEQYLGYSIRELVLKLAAELQREHNISLKEAFKRGWHLDHIKPLWSFKVKEVGDLTFRECWAIGNLKMVPAEVNLAKGGKLDHEYE